MLSLKSELDVLNEIAEAIKRQRLALNMPQAELAYRSGVPLGTLRRLEQRGHGSVSSMAKVLTSLGMTDHFLGALQRPNEVTPSLKAFVAARSEDGRQRARRKPSEFVHAAFRA